MKNRIIASNGSIQSIPNIPDDIKALYKTVWEISQKNIIDMAADRSAYIDQSQSLNIHIRDPTMGKLTSMHFHGWKKGLKTGMYYLRTQAAAAAIQFTVDKEALKVEDTTVARSLPKRTARASPINSSPAPKPMMATATRNGAATPPSTPPVPGKRFEADKAEGRSPILLAAAPNGTHPDDELVELERRRTQEEDKELDSSGREVDIYADAVLQCSIENREACEMCSA